MNGPVIQILKSYCHFSNWEVTFIALFYVLMITSFGFGLPGSLIQDAGMQQFSGAIHSPIYFMVSPRIYTQLVASRLASTQYYSLAFMAPAYRRIHLNTAIGIILVFCWIPPLAANPVDLFTTFSVTVAITGVVLSFREDAPSWLKYSLPLVGFVFFIGMLYVGTKNSLEPRWNAPIWLSTPLLVSGVILIFKFSRQYLSGHEYDITSTASSWWGPGPRDIWIKLNPYGLTNTLSRDYPQFLGIRERGIQNRIDRYRNSNRNEQAAGSLIAYATGETQHTWFYLLGTAATIILLTTLFVWSDNDDRLIQAIFFSCFTSMILMGGIVQRTFFPIWPVGDIWLRTPFSNRKAVINTMSGLRRRAALIALFLAVSIVAAAMAYELQDSQFSERMFSSRIVATSFLFGTIGYISHVIAMGMLFERFGRTAASTAMGVLPIAWAVGMIALQNFLVPEEFQLAHLPATGIVFLTGIVLLGGTYIWWHNGYFRRREWQAI